MTDTSTMMPANWESYYVMIGSSSAALIGLQFVVLTLATESRKVRIEPFALSAFATPNVIHFAGALFVSAVMTTPWRSTLPVWVALLACGAAGLIYVVRAGLRAGRQTAYAPVWEDWLWHVILPAVAYAVLASSGWLLRAEAVSAPFLAAAAALALLFVGIRNAWDTVVFLVAGHATGDGARRETK